MYWKKKKKKKEYSCINRSDLHPFNRNPFPTKVLLTEAHNYKQFELILIPSKHDTKLTPD